MLVEAGYTVIEKRYLDKNGNKKINVDCIDTDTNTVLSSANYIRKGIAYMNLLEMIIAAIPKIFNNPLK